MKKIIMLLSLLFVMSPAFAVCSITGDACTAANWESVPLQQKLIPNHLYEINKTDSFQHGYFKPYHDALINTKQEEGTPVNDYNSNCQFGVCLPGFNTGAGADIR